MGTWLDRLVQQCRMPTGWFGGLVARGMNTGHSPLTDWGLSHVSVASSATTLDIGCGGGRTLRKLAALAPEGKAYGIDLSEKSVAVSCGTTRRLRREGRVEIQRASVSHLPFANSLFDLATAIETHYFWPDLVTDMREVLRVLKPGGKLVIMGEAYKGSKFEERNRAWVVSGHMTYLAPDELAETFARAGYAGVQVHTDYDKGWICGIGERP